MFQTPHIASANVPRKAVFFDLGGTLLRMRRDQVFRIVLAEEGRRVPIEKIHAAYATVESEWLRKYGYRILGPEKSTESYRRLDAMTYRHIFPGAKADEVRRVSAHLREKWPELDSKLRPKLYSDAEPILDRLRRAGMKLALVSNAPPQTERVVEKLGLKKYIEHVVISGQVGVSKPNPRIFRLALAEVGVGPGEAVHVGDVYEADIVGARNAGIEGILVDRDGSGSAYDCPRIGSLRELPPLVL